ncbi:MAG: hypothetical protein KY432_02385 [Acidobacteria bacterium]|nr:hypothetical protein [Acidobacteriota bacterium]
MRDLLLVVRRELAERKMLMTGALVIGALIVVVPALSSGPTREMWNITSLFTSLMFGLGIAGFAASSFVASDLRERRFSFFLGRPLSMFSIWAGKMLAAWLLALICMFLVLLPVTLLGSGLMYWLSEGEGGPKVFLLALLSAAVVIPFGHAAGVALRARSTWLLADFVALSLSGLLIWAAVRPFYLQYAFGLVGSTILVSAAVLMIALLIGGYVGLSRGRIDLRNTHAYQSMITSASLIALGIAVSLFAVWVRTVDAKDINQFRLVSCMGPNCQPLMMSTSRGRGDYRAFFAMTGDELRRIDTLEDVRTASERARIVWESMESIEPPLAHLSYLDPGMDAPAKTTILVNPWASTLAVSPDGDRVAVLENQTLQIFDLDEERVIRTIRFEDARDNPTLWFTNSDTVLAVTEDRKGGSRLSSKWIGIVVDLDSGDTHEVRLPSYPYLLDQRQRLILTERAGEFFVYSTDSWELVLRTSGTSAVSTPHGLIVSRPASNQVVRIDPDTGVERVYELPADVTDIGLGPTDDTGVFLGLTRKRKLQRWASQVPDNARLVRLDLVTGELSELQADLIPARAFVPSLSGPYFVRRTTTGTQLVRIDPDSNELTVLTGNAS